VRRAAAEADHAQQQTTARLETDLAAAPVEMTAAARGAGIEAQRHALLLARRMAQAHRKQIERADTELASIRAAAEATGETARQLRSELHAARSAAKAGGVQAELARAERALETLHQDIRENGAELAAVRGSARRETLPFRAGKAAPGAETGGPRDQAFAPSMRSGSTTLSRSQPPAGVPNGGTGPSMNRSTSAFRARASLRADRERNREGRGERLW